MTALCGKEFEHRATGTASEEVSYMGVTLDFGTQYPEQVTRLALLEVLDDLLELIEEYHQRPPATRPLDASRWLRRIVRIVMSLDCRARQLSRCTRLMCANSEI